MKHHMKATVAVTLAFSVVFAANAMEKPQSSAKVLDLRSAVETAVVSDPWLAGNRHAEDALLSQSVAAGELPDPKMSLGIANLPTDSLSFSQEAMTQVKVGLSQNFPAGDSLAIRRRQLELESTELPFQRQDRKGKIAVTVGRLWLDAYNARESINIIEKNRALFEQLVDVAESGYAAALGKSRQQDVIRAQLELTRLDDRLTILRQRQEMFERRLAEWLNGDFVSRYSDAPPQETGTPASDFSLARKIPDIGLLNQHLYGPAARVNPEMLYENLSGHPALQAVEQKIRASEAGVDLARQKYKPEWGVNAGYAYRAGDPLGNSRSDFFSVGVTLSIPLFTASRQDKEVQSARSRTSAVRTEKWRLLRKLTASFETAKAELLRLDERQKLYDSLLLPQMREQAEASLTAYTNDDGDFAEAVRARIAEMDAEVDALNIDVARQKTILQLNYLFMTNTDEIIAGASHPGESK